MIFISKKFKLFYINILYMDQIYFWIIVLFLVILYLDYCEKNYKKEGFTNKEPISNNINQPYFEENKLKVNNFVSTNAAVNLNNKNLNFKNFTTDAMNPPYLKCSNCKLEFGCVDFPYEVDDKNQSVCHKCDKNLCNYNMNYPVYGKAAGRPRVCRNLK